MLDAGALGFCLFVIVSDLDAVVGRIDGAKFSRLELLFLLVLLLRVLRSLASG
jgi:hypothetical protein